MKREIVMQECQRCGKQFPIMYFSNGSYEYFGGKKAPCDCEAEYSPVEGVPSISEWLENIKKQKKPIRSQ